MRRHIFLPPDIADGGFESVSLCLVTPDYHIRMQMDTEPGGQKMSQWTDLDSKMSYYSLFVLEETLRM